MTYNFSPKWEATFLGNAAINTYRFTPHSRETSFGTMNNTQKFTVYFPNSNENDRFQTLFGALTLAYKPKTDVEVGIQASAFDSQEEERYDIMGEYWLSDGTDSNSGLMPAALPCR